MVNIVQNISWVQKINLACFFCNDNKKKQLISFTNLIFLTLDTLAFF